MMEDIVIKSERYVYFDETGSILKILNYKEPGGTHIKVEYADVADMLSGKKAFFNFIVVYNSELSAYVLTEKITNNTLSFNASEYIYEIPKASVDPFVDLTIIQNLIEKKWVIKLRKTLRDQLRLQQMSVGVPMTISITKVGNPHILYRMISVSIDELLYSDKEFSIDFQYDTEASEDLSIFTIKKLKTYKHEVVNG